ncbi:hypothetical protein N7462_003418 [Penicillium macrosclerotiorum]|uniref:uncharacterized protein n=1 Tax=Penicillium macrosclerotiorum TaxID=303699 RepID=UPI002549112F|nr:uncharacterized protein N7462_003418 [Penicillium macrosclerotiorum]KAJ5689026.1 hypothetical protein N7462_003418 [Penicillium macrosclerotiorum]
MPVAQVFLYSIELRKGSSNIRLHDFSSVLNRLDDVDRSLAHLSQQVESLAANRTQAALPLTLSTTDDQNGPEIGRDERPSTDVTSNSFLLSEGYGERLYGYPAALCLFRASQKLLAAGLNAKSPPLHGPLAESLTNTALRPSLMRHCEKFPFQKRCTEQPITADQGPITSPPQDVVYSILDRFMNHVNLHVPVFEADILYDTIPDCYQSNGPPVQAAWMVCLNCIVLLTLHLDAGVVRRSGIQVNAWSKHSEVIDDSLKNCHRALADLDALLQPTIVNIQALIMLALVAREFFINTIFEKVCSAACKLAQSMGLHRSVGIVDDRALEARQRLFWIVYSMDKTRVFLGGHPPDLYLFNTEFQPRLSAPEMSVESQLRSAAAHIMTVWEEIYIGLYSVRAVRMGAEHRHNQVDRLDHLCDKYLPLVPSQVSRDPGLRLMQLEITYCYHVSKILIHRCHRTTEEWQTTHEHAVFALQTITDVFEGPVTPGSCVVLSRIFQNYPLVAFHDLCVRYLAGDGSDDVAAIVPRLINVRRQLSSLAHQDIRSAYITKLHLGVAWCIDLISMITNSNQTLELTACLLTPSTSTDMGDSCPSASAEHDSKTYWLGAGNTLTQEQAAIFETFDSPDFFFDQALFEALLPEGHFTT